MTQSARFYTSVSRMPLDFCYIFNKTVYFKRLIICQAYSLNKCGVQKHRPARRQFSLKLRLSPADERMRSSRAPQQLPRLIGRLLGGRPVTRSSVSFKADTPCQWHMSFTHENKSERRCFVFPQAWLMYRSKCIIHVRKKSLTPDWILPRLIGQMQVCKARITTCLRGAIDQALHSLTPKRKRFQRSVTVKDISAHCHPTLNLREFPRHSSRLMRMDFTAASSASAHVCSLTCCKEDGQPWYEPVQVHGSLSTRSGGQHPSRRLLPNIMDLMFILQLGFCASVMDEGRLCKAHNLRQDLTPPNEVKIEFK